MELCTQHICDSFAQQHLILAAMLQGSYHCHNHIINARHIQADEYSSGVVWMGARLRTTIIHFQAHDGAGSISYNWLHC